MKRPFLAPRLIGQRYSENSVPLEVLREWASFEDLVLEVARRLYLQDNPERQRVPRGFVEGFALHLSGVTEGSAIPQIDRVLLGGRQEVLDHEIYYVRARDLALAVIAAAAIQAPMPVAFPADLLTRFDPIGRSLRDDEKIEFRVPNVQDPVAILDRATHKSIVLRAAKEYQSEADLRGQITELDLARGTFQLSLLDGTRVPGTLTRDTRKPIHDAFEGYFNDRQKVRILAFAALDANDRPKGLVEVLQVEALDPLDVPARLEELKNLRDGWMDGTGLAPSKEGIEWIAANWDLYPADLPNPYAYPTLEGDVQLEWGLDAWELSAEVSLDGKVAHCLAVDTASDANREFEFDLADRGGWMAMIEWVRKRGDL